MDDGLGTSTDACLFTAVLSLLALRSLPLPVGRRIENKAPRQEHISYGFRRGGGVIRPLVE